MKKNTIISAGLTLVFIASLFLLLKFKSPQKTFPKIQEIRKQGLKPRDDINFFSTTTDMTKIPPEIPPPQVVATTSANPVQSGQIDEHLFVDNTLRDVDFCGETYRVKQVFIDGVDVVQRIAELVKKGRQSLSKSVKEFANSVCESTHFQPSNYQSGELNVDKVWTYAFNLPPEKMDETNKTYEIRVGSVLFLVAIQPSINAIYTVNGYDGTPKYVTNFK